MSVISVYLCVITSSSSLSTGLASSRATSSAVAAILTVMAASQSGSGLGVGQETRTQSRPRRLCSTYSPIWRPHGPYSPLAASCALTASIDCAFSSPKEGFMGKLPLKQKDFLSSLKGIAVFCLRLDDRWNCWMVGGMGMTHRSAKKELIQRGSFWECDQTCGTERINIRRHVRTIRFLKSEGGSWALTDSTDESLWALNWGKQACCGTQNLFIFVSTFTSRE